MKVVFLAPGGGKLDGRRSQLWGFCSSWWGEHFPDVPVYLGIPDRESPYNRGQAINRAASAAGEWDIAVIIDRDILVEKQYLDKAIERAFQTGRAVLPYQTYYPLSQQMTDKVLGGFQGDWTKGIDLKCGVMKNGRHVSSCVVVPRKLWDKVQGFDERFEGWGPEDRAFHASLRVMGGGVETIDGGSVFHLWHPWSPETDPKSPLLQAGKALADRYYRSVLPYDMVDLIEEREVSDCVLAIVMTHGRYDCIGRAIHSFQEEVSGRVAYKIIVDDSGDPDYQAWLRIQFPDWWVSDTGGKKGFSGAYRHAWWEVSRRGFDWAFIIEDDFEFVKPFKLDSLQSVMLDNPHLVQMALRRQAWFKVEIEAGGVIEQNPDKYEDFDNHLEHRLFITTNPALWRRDFIIRNPWPSGARSEARFAQEVFKDPVLKSGYWGTRTDDPWVIHDGPRTGKGY